MTDGQISEELSEPERRKLVKQIAERGTAGHRIKEEVVAPSYDYAAAAEAAAVADPVDLGPAAMGELTEGVNQMASDAERYAEAQRAIFARGRGRELAYGNEFYDRKAQQHKATNHVLDMMATEIAEQKASGRGRGRGSVTEEGPTGGLTDLLNDLHPIQAERTEDAIVGFQERWGGEVDEVMVAALDRGLTYQEAANAVRQAMRADGVPAREVEDYLVGIERAYAGMFPPEQQGEAPRFGPYRPTAGNTMGPGVVVPDRVEPGSGNFLSGTLDALEGWGGGGSASEQERGYLDPGTPYASRPAPTGDPRGNPGGGLYR